MIAYNDKQLQMENDICKNHSARMEREFRLSVSKLSRQNLEDVYFELLQNNQELKRTINVQHDKIKVLSTKVLRMTSAQVFSGKEHKECCATARAAVIEQRNIIADLKQANARMSEKVRMYNMKLCSAKQFLKTTPHSGYRCTKCRTAPPLSIKISSASAINSKRSEENDKICEIKRRQNADSEECTNRNVTSTRTVETETSEKDISQLLCEENKCKILREELEQKIVELQKEMDKMQSEYSDRVSVLQQQMSVVRTAHADAERRLRTSEHDADSFATRLREAETQCGEFSVLLCIERKRVAELETRLKVAAMSTHVARTVQQHLGTDNIRTPTSKLVYNSSDVTPSKYSDDSGYVEEKSPESKELTSKHNELIVKMSELQAQLDSLKDCVDNEVSYSRDTIRTMEFISSNSTQTDEDVLKDVNGFNRTVNGEIDHVNSDNIKPPERDKPIKQTSCEMEKETVKWQKETSESQDNTSTPNKEIENILEDTITRDSDIECIAKVTVTSGSNKNISSDVVIEETAKEIESTRSSIVDKNTISLDKPTNIKTTITNDHRKNSNCVVNKQTTKKTTKLNKSKSVDENRSKETKVAVKKNKRIKSVDVPTSTVVTHIKPSSVAMEIRFEEKIASTDQFEDNQLGTQIEQLIEQNVKSSPGTYTVVSRASTPEDTDREISSLTDLSAERVEKTTPILSPGEERFTTTYSLSDSSPVTFENGSLSEGELPGARRFSIGEREVTASKPTNKMTIQESSSQRMQSTLRAVSEELSRCKHLLLSERPKKVDLNSQCRRQVNQLQGEDQSCLG